MRKPSDKLKLMDILQNTWSIYLKTVKAIKTHSQEEPKEV